MLTAQDSLPNRSELYQQWTLNEPRAAPGNSLLPLSLNGAQYPGPSSDGSIMSARESKWNASLDYSTYQQRFRRSTASRGQT